MDTSPRIVLAETDPARFLRFVLEGEGLPVIGLASNDDELRRVLRGVRPAVVVIDAGITAATALEIREDHPDASLVVVWPPGIAAVLAHEHVEPDRIVEDLGDAVRRGLASADEREADRVRQLEQIGLPPHLRRLLATRDEDEPPAPSPAAGASRPTPIGRARHAIALTAAVWILTLALATAMAATAPSAIRFFREFGRPAPERTPPAVVSSPSARASATTEDERVAPGGPQTRRGDERADDDRRCGVSDHRSQDRGRRDDRGCSDDHRQDGGKGTPEGHDPDGGKPDGTPGGGKPEDTGNAGDHGKPDGTPGGGKPEDTGKPDGTGTPEGTGKPVSEPAGGGRSAARSERPRR